MTDLHARLKRTIEGMLAVSMAATPPQFRHWIAYPHPPGGRDADKTKDVHLVGSVNSEHDGGPEWLICEAGQHLGAAFVARFIAAHDPAWAIRQHEAALRSIEIHQPFPHRTGLRCVHCQDGTEPWPCGEFEIVADAYGLSIEVSP